MMLCKPKKSALYRRVRRIICIFLIVLVLLSAFLEFAVKAQLSDAISAEMKDLAQSAVDSAVVDYLKENPDIGERLTRARYSESGSVTSLTSDPSAVNTLKASISNLSRDYIDRTASEQGLSLPLGSFSGFVFLTNLGPMIDLDIACRSSVVCTLNSAFESGGVNQTLQRVTLTVDIEIVVYNPFRMSPIHTSTDYEIARTVIVGDVPTYTYASPVR